MWEKKAEACEVHSRDFNSRNIQRKMIIFGGRQCVTCKTFNLIYFIFRRALEE